MSKKTSADFSDVTLVSEYTCADNEDRRPLLAEFKMKRRMIDIAAGG